MPNQVTVQLGGVTNTCFVVMPFAALFEREYTLVIKPAVESIGLECVRGDEIYNEQSIIQDIWKSLRTSRVVVAELSGRNPNVMYEVGLAHAIGKPIILLTRNQEDVPFDLKSLRYIYYDVNNPDWGSDLRDELAQIIGKVLENPSLSAHLNDVKAEVILPASPVESLQRPANELVPVSLSGIWRTNWISTKMGREHVATLVIPENQGKDFTASMTISYLRDDEQTVVEETLKGMIEGSKVSLIGVNYTYVRRGRSRAYGLDRFDLVLSSAENSLDGEAHFRYESRQISFKKSQVAATST